MRNCNCGFETDFSMSSHRDDCAIITEKICATQTNFTPLATAKHGLTSGMKSLIDAGNKIEAIKYHRLNNSHVNLSLIDAKKDVDMYCFSKNLTVDSALYKLEQVVRDNPELLACIEFIKQRYV